MKSSKIQELDDEIETIQNDLISMTQDNIQVLNGDQETLDKIENEKLIKIDNEIKKASWFRKGMKSTTGWLKNLFITPKMKSTIQEPNDAEINKGVCDDKAIDKEDTLLESVKNEKLLIEEQSEQLKRIKVKVEDQNYKIQKINEDINRM